MALEWLDNQQWKWIHQNSHYTEQLTCDGV